MKPFYFLIVVISSLTLAACGKSDSEKGGQASGIKDNEIVDIYVAHLNDIADALDAVEDEQTARKAAEKIAKARNDIEAIAYEVQGMSNAKRAMLFAARAKDLAEPQMRFSMAMQRITTENPEYWETIADELDKMPDLYGEE